MLKTIRVVTFRGLRNVAVDVKPLTVLIGPNDTGKTSFLEAIAYLLRRRGTMQEDNWRGQPGTPLVEADSTTGQITSAPPSNPPPVTCAMLRLPAQGVYLNSIGLNDGPEPPPLDMLLTSLPTFIDYLLRRDRPRFFAIVDAMKKLVPGFEDIDVVTPDPSNRRLDVVVEHGLRVTGDQVSAGVRLLLFFVALAHHPRPPNVILLEEPENGVHPKRLQEIMKLIRGVTEGAYGGQRAQVILTTHSPYLLDCVDLARDQVLVFRRQEDGGRTAEPIDAGRLKGFLGEFMLGEVWYNVGDAELVAKKT